VDADTFAETAHDRSQSGLEIFIFPFFPFPPTNPRAARPFCNKARVTSCLRMALSTSTTTHLVFLMVGSTVAPLARFAAKKDADATVERLCETDAYTLSPDIFIFSASFDSTMEVLSGAEAQETFVRTFAKHAYGPPPMVCSGPAKLVSVGDSDSEADDGILPAAGVGKSAASESNSEDDGPPPLLENGDD